MTHLYGKCEDTKEFTDGGVLPVKFSLYCNHSRFLINRKVLGVTYNIIIRMVVYNRIRIRMVFVFQIQLFLVKEGEPGTAGDLRKEPARWRSLL